jgi:hypothetical protein
MANQKATKYRAEAGKVRSEAERTSDPQSRRALLDIAKQYERLAEWAERRSGPGNGV